MNKIKSNKQSKIPVLRTTRNKGKLVTSQRSLEDSEKENSQRSTNDIFNLEELLCDIQDSIERKQPNLVEEMKEIINVKDQLSEQLEKMKSEQSMLHEHEINEKNRILRENSELQHKWVESQSLVDEITLKLEEESSRVKDFESKGRVQSDLSTFQPSTQVRIVICYCYD